MIWPQDQVPQPIRSRNAGEDPALRLLDKSEYNYTGYFDFATAEFLYTKNFRVPLSCDFYISMFNISNFDLTTQVVNTVTAPGYLTITDNTTGYRLIDNVQLSYFQNQSTYLRSIWPMPHPIGAGASFEVKINIQACTTSSTRRQFFVIGGWKDYTMFSSKGARK